MFRLGASVAFVLAIASPDADLEAQFSDDSLSLLQLRAEKNNGIESKLASARKDAMETMELMAEKEVDLGMGMESKLVLARKEAMENMELMAKEEVDFQEDGSADYYSYYYSSLLQEDELGMGMGMMGMGKMGMMGMGKMGMMGMMGMGKMGMMGMGAQQDDEAAAVGDPHLTLTGGEQNDLCCDGGHCEPCPVALVSKVHSVEGDGNWRSVNSLDVEPKLAAGREAALDQLLGGPTIALTSISMGSKLASARKEAKDAMDYISIESKLASDLKEAVGSMEWIAEKEVNLGMGMGKMGMGKMGMGKMGMGKMGMGMMGKMGMMGMMGMGAPDVVVDPVVEEEAAAVGDPHMTLTSGESDDMCCESGSCKPCPVALLQESDDYYSYYYSSLLQEDGSKVEKPRRSKRR